MVTAVHAAGGAAKKKKMQPAAAEEFKLIQLSGKCSRKSSCGRQSHKRGDQEGMLLSIDKHYRGNTTDISLCSRV